MCAHDAVGRSDPIRVMIGSLSPRAEGLAAKVRSQPDLDLIAVSHDGSDVVNTVLTQLPQVLVLDLILPSLDGLGVIQRVRTTLPAPGPMIIVLVEGRQEWLFQHLLASGGDYCLVRPVDPGLVVSRIRQFAQSAPRALPLSDPDGKGAEQVSPYDVAELLLKVGVRPDLQGYRYLRTAIGLVSKRPALLNAFTKELYPTVAAMHRSTATRVERSMRHAVASAWERECDYPFVGTLFRACAAHGVVRPTNAEFIATLADYLLYQATPRG